MEHLFFSDLLEAPDNQHNDIRHCDTQRNDIRHCDIQQNGIRHCDTQHNVRMFRPTGITIMCRLNDVRPNDFRPNDAVSFNCNTRHKQLSA